MAKIVLRAGKVAIKIIILFVILGFIFYSVKLLVPAKANVESVGDVTTQLEQAEAYVAQGQYDQATAIYNSIVADVQVDTQGQVFARGGLIVVSVHRGDITAAEASLESLMTNYDDEVAVPAAVFDAAHAFSPTRPDKAITLFQQILDTWPNCEDAIRCQVSLVRENLTLNNAAGAESAYQELLTKFSGHADMPDAIYTVGEIYTDLDPQKSLELYQEVVDKWPDSQEAVMAQMGVVRINIELKNEAAAQSAYQKLITQYSAYEGLPGAIVMLADCYLNPEPVNPQRAIEMFQHVLKNWPGSDQVMWAQGGVAVSYAALGNYTEADAAQDNLLTDFANSPDLPEIFLEIGSAYYREARYRAIGGDTESEKASYRNAISVWERLLQEFPDSEAVSHAYYFSARCYESIGEYEDAIRYYQKVVDDWPDEVRSPSLLYRITNLYEKLEKSGQISTMDASIEIRQACKKLLEDYSASRYVDEMRKTLEHWNFIYAWLLSQQK
jgi:tetratricopeptide (TPR) repeat protein